MKQAKSKSDKLKEKDTRIDKKIAETSDDLELVPGNEADVTEDDLEALGPVDLSMDLGDDEDLKHRVYPVDFSGEDLDVPGAELDDDEEDIGSEDEENNLYSNAQE